jgi:hypothetical protein
MKLPEGLDLCRGELLGWVPPLVVLPMYEEVYGLTCTLVSLLRAGTHCATLADRSRNKRSSSLRLKSSQSGYSRKADMRVVPERCSEVTRVHTVCMLHTEHPPCPVTATEVNE